MQEFQVRTTVLPDGERLAILTGRDGLPVFSPNVYAISQLRGRNLAFATISNSLRALIVLEQFLGSHGSGIDLRSRIAAGQLLSVAEIDALAIACRLPMNHFHGASELASYRRASATTQLESHRNRAPTSRDSLISPQAAATRLQSIRGYLVWLVGVRCTDSTTSPEVRESLLATSKFTFDAISARLPRGRYRSWGKELEGLDDGPAATLLDLINPEADDKRACSCGTYRPIKACIPARLWRARAGISIPSCRAMSLPNLSWLSEGGLRSESSASKSAGGKCWASRR